MAERQRGNWFGHPLTTWAVVDVCTWALLVSLMRWEEDFAWNFDWFMKGHDKTWHCQPRYFPRQGA